MRIAVAKDGEWVAAHFGRCPEYLLVDVAGGQVTQERVIPNPGHEPGFLPRFLARLGVDCILAGGMGPRAEHLFAEEGIAAVVGVQGRVDVVVRQYLEGALAPGPSQCQHGEGHECRDGDHGEE